MGNRGNLITPGICENFRKYGQCGNLRNLESLDNQLQELWNIQKKQFTVSKGRQPLWDIPTYCYLCGCSSPQNFSCCKGRLGTTEHAGKLETNKDHV